MAAMRRAISALSQTKWFSITGNKQTKWFSITGNKNIMSSAYNATDALEQLKENPYYTKYSKKIAALQNISPEEFETRLKDTHEKNTTSKSTSHEERTFSSVSDCPKQHSSKLHSPTFTKPKVLKDVMKMELISDKSSVEIKAIWELHHRKEQIIAAVVPDKTYDIIYLRSQKFPIFIFPLPRKSGYEFIMCQFSEHEAHFTPLINYQAHKENAPECMTLVYYTDVKDKGIVLMRGEYNKDVLNGLEAQCLVNQVQLYYGEEDTVRTKLLERFTLQPQEFKHMDLIAELECLSL